jgi:hemolysin activation/secretion protein
MVCAADSRNGGSEPATSDAEVMLKLEKKAEAARQLREKREAAAKAKREAAEKAKAKREEKARLAKLDAEAREQAQAEIRQARSERKAKLAALDSKAAPELIARQKKQIETQYRQQVAKIKMKLRHRKEAVQIEHLNLPEDKSRRLTVKDLRISGNTLVSTAELFENMPLVYNASDMVLRQADSAQLYDFSTLSDVILKPGQPRQLSARTIQGFTQYILSVYQGRHYGGVYVYVPEEAISGTAALKDDLLPVRVLELPVSEIAVSTYDPERQEVEEGHLSHTAVQQWSPVKVGEVVNQKELDDFVNLLNRNPDRYVSALISSGTEPNTLSLGYDIYEADPWHFYIQVDNGSTEERQWAPRIGLINTNLIGIDDRFTAMYQAPWESGIEDNYFLFGSYDFPVFTPRLRLNLYSGYNEFDVTPEGGAFNFLGRGSFYGGVLRYNVLQAEGWFLDVTGSLGRERSRVTPSLFPAATSDIKMNLYGVGIDVHHLDDVSSTSIGFTRFENIGGSRRSEFDLARTGASSEFRIYTLTAGHSRYLDSNKVQRLSGSFRLIDPSRRLVPAKMTTFGGLYSIRGYDEDEIVADGGIVVSFQYEFDLIKHDAEQKAAETDSQLPQAEEDQWLRKFAPLAFLDYGRAKIEDDRAGEEGTQELCSLGLGTIFEVADNFSGALYYGWPLNSTDETDEGKGRFNISLILRW